MVYSAIVAIYDRFGTDNEVVRARVREESRSTEVGLIVQLKLMNGVCVPTRENFQVANFINCNFSKVR